MLVNGCLILKKIKNIDRKKQSRVKYQTMQYAA